MSHLALGGHPDLLDVYVNGTDRRAAQKLAGTAAVTVTLYDRYGKQVGRAPPRRRTRDDLRSSRAGSAR